MSTANPNIKPLDSAIYDRIIEVVRRVVAVRAEQEHEWGESNHEPEFWMILMQKQLGKAMAAYLDSEPDEMMRRLVHSTAVNIAMIECGLRRKWGKLS